MPCPCWGMTEAARLVAMTTGRRFGLGHLRRGVEMYRASSPITASRGDRLLLRVAATPQDALTDPAASRPR